MTTSGADAVMLDSSTSPLHDLEARVLAHPGVHDCAVLRRSGRDGASLVVAYVVTPGKLTLEDLSGFIRQGGGSVLPDALVRVSTIPLRDDGRVDEKVLVALPVVDAATLERCRAMMRSAGGVADVEVVSEMRVPPEAGLRVDALLPGWSRSPVARAGPADAHPAPDPGGAPSISVGDPIDWGGDRPSRLADLLVRAAERFPAHGVTCIERDGEHVMTYPELMERARRVMAGLVAVGLRPGDPVLFQLDRNVDFVAAFWGCVLGGFVPAPIAVPATPDPTSGPATKLRNVWQLLGRPRVLTSAAAEPALLRLRDLLDAPDMRLVTVDQLLQSSEGEGWHEAAPDDLALLLLTSGSTGVPKAVTQTQSSLLAACAAMSQRNSFSSSDVSLNWISLDHVGGLVMCHLMYVALGSRQVHVRTEHILQDPLRWLDLIDRFRASFTWAPNFAFALVNDRANEVAQRRWDLSSMRFVLNGGEAVVAQTARRFLRLLAPHGLPATAMHPAWGMSETSSAAAFADPFLLDATRDTDELVEVGPPDPEFEIRIVDDRDQLVPQGQEGRLHVRGPNVTQGYLHNPKANAESFTADGWFRTGDLGRLTAGRLTITGREKGIIINGVNYYAHEIEAAVENVDGVTPSFAAAFAVRELGAETDALVVAFHTSNDDDEAIVEVLRRVRAAVLERVGVVPRYLLPVGKNDIPKTDIGKIQRPALTKRFEAGGLDAYVKRVEQLTQRADTLPDWFFRAVWRKRESVPHRPVGPDCVVLLLAAESDLTSALEHALHATGARVVRAGGDGLARAVAAVPVTERLIVVSGEQHGQRPSAGGHDEPDLVLRAVERLVSLVRTLAQSPRSSAPCELLVYDGGAQHVVPGDRVVVGKASVLGIVRTAAAEHPEISVRHVDLPGAPPASLAGLLLGELADRSEEPEVAYREGTRWVRRLTKRAPFPVHAGHALGRTDGFYVVTGALGGIGAEVCRHLLRTAETPILLVGRTPLAGAADERRATLASLQALGEVHFEALDVADHDALERAVAAAAMRWKRALAGVLHLAGVYEPRLLAAETAETLSVALHAKVHGAWSIHRLLLRHPGAALIVFSSVNGYLGGYGAGAYAAANTFGDSLVQHHVAELGRRAYSLGWSLWDGIGMSREFAFKESAARRGFRALSTPQGVMSLVAAVGSEPGQLLIGLDGANPHIQQYVEDVVVAETVGAYCVRAAGPGAAPVAVPTLSDPFGAPVPCRVQDVADLAWLREPGGRPSTGGDAVASEPSFGNDLERTIASVWSAVLPSGAIGPNDNFFEAGGNSLLVATACRKLQQELGRDVPLTDVYRFPTLRLLAQAYGGAGQADSDGLDDSEKRGKARRAQRAQQRGRGL